jgi:hypothetical protein
MNLGVELLTSKLFWLFQREHLIFEKSIFYYSAVPAREYYTARTINAKLRYSPSRLLSEGCICLRVRPIVREQNIIKYKQAMIVPTKSESNTELIAMLGQFAAVRSHESTRLTAVCV